jgi:hypothetical protein
MIKLAYQAEREYNNAKGIILRATFSGNYGAQGVGDLLNLTPSQNGGLDGGITDPKAAYDHILGEPPNVIAILNANIGGYTASIKPNAVPTLTNFGLQIWDAVTEITTEAYASVSALIVAGYVDIEVLVPLQ